MEKLVSSVGEIKQILLPYEEELTLSSPYLDQAGRMTSLGNSEVKVLFKSTAEHPPVILTVDVRDAEGKSWQDHYTDDREVSDIRVHGTEMFNDFAADPFYSRNIAKVFGEKGINLYSSPGMKEERSSGKVFDLRTGVITAEQDLSEIVSQVLSAQSGLLKIRELMDNDIQRRLRYFC